MKCVKPFIKILHNHTFSIMQGLSATKASVFFVETRFIAFLQKFFPAPANPCRLCALLPELVEKAHSNFNLYNL